MNDQSPITMQANAAVETPNASRYLQQLCKHFGHKCPVSFDEKAGIITFAMGTCRLAATDTTLELWLASHDQENLDRLKDVVASHLLRFAFREELAISWR